MQSNNLHSAIKYSTKVAILSALAAVTMLLEFPLPFLAPPFYEFDFSDLFALLGGFALGPTAGVLIELIKNLLNLLLNGTDTAFAGEFANFVTGVALVLPASLIYRYRRTRKGALVGLLAGTLSLVVIGAFLNYWFLIPFFSKLYEMPLDVIVSMGTKINSHIVSLRTLVMFATVPFNLLKGVVISALTLLLYKRLSPLLHK